jgi:hypothetical protein
MSRTMKSIAALAVQAVALAVSLRTPAVHASELSSAAAAMAPGEWRQMTVGGPVTTCNVLIPNDTVNGPTNPDLTILQYTDQALWNPLTHEVWVMGTARPYGTADSQIGVYSEGTNSWRLEPLPSFGIGFHNYQHGVIDPATGDIYHVSADSTRIMHRRNAATGLWESAPTVANVPSQYGTTTASMAYFPEAGGITFLTNVYGYLYGGEVWVYNKAGNSWGCKLHSPFSCVPSGTAKPGSGIEVGLYEFMSLYDPIDKLLYIGGGAARGTSDPNVPPDIIDTAHTLYTMDRNGVITTRNLGNAPVALGEFGEGATQVVDPVSGRLLAFAAGSDPANPGSCLPSLSWEFNPTTNTWTRFASHPLRPGGVGCAPSAAAVPIPELGVIFIADWNSGPRSAGDCRVWIYKHSPTGGGGGTTPPPSPASVRVR